MPQDVARRVVRVAVGEVDVARAGQLAQPGELALGVAARAQLHRRDVAARAAPRSRAPGARTATRRRRAARHTSSAAPSGDHGLDARVDPAVERLALHRERDEQGRVAGVGSSTAGRPPAAASPWSSSSSARTTAGRRSARSAPRPPGRGRRARRAARARPRGEAARVVLAARRVGGRAQVEVGERRAQVEPGAADDDRAAAGGDQPVDLRVGAAGELARGRAAGDRQDAEQPVLEPRPLAAASRRR